MNKLQSSSTKVSAKEFDAIYSVFMKTSPIRNDFFRDPGATLEKKGILLDPEIIKILKRIGVLRIEGNRMNFNEKLVLCSSAGL